MEKESKYDVSTSVSYLFVQDGEEKKLYINGKLVGQDEDLELLEKCYQVYLDVQKAWMNFNYEELRKLLTDELFNMYQNQLRTLELKEEQNIMRDFVLKKSNIISKEEVNNVTTIKMGLSVSFYDYIVDKNKKTMRGDKLEKVVMTYMLTFIKEETKIENCPHCGAKLESGETICPYCNTKLLMTDEIRLSKKEVIRQIMER